MINQGAMTSKMSKRHYFYSERWQVLEERQSSNPGFAERQFVWGERSVDDLVLRERSVGEDVSSSSSSEAHMDARLYATTDQWSVTACVNELGRVAERYAYEGFGASLVLSPEFESSGSAAGSLYDWETRYGGYRFDAETEMYQVRFRYLQPGLGRWMSRDPIATMALLAVFERNFPRYQGVWWINHLNRQLYQFVGNNPPNRRDSLGLDWLSNLTQADWCCLHPRCCKWAKDMASDIQKEQLHRYGRDPDNGVINAVKHCALMCRVSAGKVCSDEATQKLGFAHENTYGPNPGLPMDIWNNQVGIGLSHDNMTLDECYDECEKAARDGKLRWIESTSPTGLKHKGKDLVDDTPPVYPPPQ